MRRNWGKLAGLLAVMLFGVLSIVMVVKGEAVPPINQTPTFDSGPQSAPGSSPATPDPNGPVSNPNGSDANSVSKPPAPPKPSSPKPPANNYQVTRPEDREPEEKEPVEISATGRGWWIDVSISEQSVRIFKDGRLQKQMIASTGTKDKPTPLGQFKIQNRGLWFFSQKYQQGGKYWVSFKNWGQYLFHSVPMDKNQNILPEEASKLGQPASHGCIRLAIADAKWIYDNIPQGTPVNIHQ